MPVAILPRLSFANNRMNSTMQAKCPQDMHEVALCQEKNPLVLVTRLNMRQKFMCSYNVMDVVLCVQQLHKDFAISNENCDQNVVQCCSCRCWLLKLSMICDK